MACLLDKSLAPAEAIAAREENAMARMVVRDKSPGNSFRVREYNGTCNNEYLLRERRD